MSLGDATHGAYANRSRRKKPSTNLDEILRTTDNYFIEVADISLRIVEIEPSGVNYNGDEIASL